MKSGTDAWRKRLAVQLAAQLPEKPEDARVVIEYLNELLRDFLSTPRHGLRLVDGDQMAPSLRANSTGKPEGSP